MAQHSSRVVPHPAVDIYNLCYVASNNWSRAFSAEVIRRETVVVEFKVLPRHFARRGLRKPTQILSQDSLCPCQEFIGASPIYKSGNLPG
jgi:hypothetical protein